MTIRHLAALAAAAVLITGCSSGGAASVIERVSGPEKNATYETIENLRDAAVEAGVMCPDWEQTNNMKFAAASGECSDVTSMSIYSSPGALDNQLEGMVEARELLTELLDGDTSTLDENEPVLVGPNWIINAPNPAAIQQKLGGTLQKW